MLLSQIVVVVLLGAAGLCTAAESQRALRCPDLSFDRVCAAAEAGFDYSDGCNGIICSGEGLASTTLMACPAPSSQEEQLHCERLARGVWDRLGPFTCINVDPATVCAVRAAGFAFSDGCNRVRCAKNGGFVSTKMSCKITDPEGPYCRLVAAALAGSGRGSGGGGPSEDKEKSPGGSSEASFECPNLQYTRVCAEHLPYFTYNDGCRDVTCRGVGLARLPSDSRDCPEPEPGNAAAAAFCAAAERRMQEKKARSSFYTSCLQADSVCRAARTSELTFNDGCNRCFCLRDRSAACTKVACPPRFLTPEEFSDHCRLVGAGVITK